MSNPSPDAISKTLSANDTGETGGHQAGILVPKGGRILSFFPALDKNSKNPRHTLVFYDDAAGRWDFEFIYYNNVFFGGTRNEYRLTGMTSFFRSHNLKAGDELLLRRDDDSRRYVTYKRLRAVIASGTGKLHLGSTWKVIEI